MSARSSCMQDMHELCTKGCIQSVSIANRYRPPALLGFLQGMSRMQGLERADEYAKRAVESAVKLYRRMKGVGETQ